MVASANEDALSCLLEAVRLTTVEARISRLDALSGGRNSDATPCLYVLVDGECSLEMGVGNTFTLSIGDMAILPARTAHRLACPIPSSLICVTFLTNDRETEGRLPALPPIHVKKETGILTAEMIRLTAMLIGEMASDQGGTRAVVNHLAHVLFLQGFRAYLSTLADCGQTMQPAGRQQIGLALNVIETRMDEPWTLVGLARECGMSRSSFAENFRRIVGMPPIAHLFELRMRKACDLLTHSTLSIKEVSGLSGYQSQSAFCNAFRRRTGMAPGAYRQSRRGKTR